MSPKVSIIIPTYNVEEYLEECLNTVTRQTLEDIEIICVNDGSTDNSLTIINRFANKDDRIVLLDGPNGGYGRAMNRGLDRATGEYIGIVEPDDFVAITMYEDLYNLARQHDLDFVKADFYRFVRHSNGDMRLSYNHLDRAQQDYAQVFTPRLNPRSLMFIMNTWSGIYRRSFIEEHGIRHHETPGASFQDNGFWFQTFAYAERAMIVDTPYYRNRRDNPNSSVNDAAKVYCINKEYDYIEDMFRENEEIWDCLKYMFWLKRFYNYEWTLRRILPEFKREYLQYFSRDFRRAQELSELDSTLFAKKQWKMLEQIIADPDKFYRKQKNKAKLASAAKRAYHASKRGPSKVKKYAKRLIQ